MNKMISIVLKAGFLAAIMIPAVFTPFLAAIIWLTEDWFKFYLLVAALLYLEDYDRSNGRATISMFLYYVGLLIFSATAALWGSEHFQWVLITLVLITLFFSGILIESWEELFVGLVASTGVTTAIVVTAKNPKPFKALFGIIAAIMIAVIVEKAIYYLSRAWVRWRRGKESEVE